MSPTPTASLLFVGISQGRIGAAEADADYHGLPSS
jgi:hypothetical protein